MSPGSALSPVPQLLSPTRPLTSLFTSPHLPLHFIPFPSLHFLSLSLHSLPLHPTHYFTILSLLIYFFTFFVNFLVSPLPFSSHLSSLRVHSVFLSLFSSSSLSSSICPQQHITITQCFLLLSNVQVFMSFIFGAIIPLHLPFSYSFSSSSLSLTSPAHLNSSSHLPPPPFLFSHIFYFSVSSPFTLTFPLPACPFPPLPLPFPASLPSPATFLSP